MARFVAFLRAVNVGKRTVAMATARQALADLGFADVSSYVNSGNLFFSATGPASDHEVAIRARLEEVFGFELTTFVRTAAQVRDLVAIQTVWHYCARADSLRPSSADPADRHREARRRRAVQRSRRGCRPWARRALAHPFPVNRDHTRAEAVERCAAGQSHHCPQHDDADKIGRPALIGDLRSSHACQSARRDSD